MERQQRRPHRDLRHSLAAGEIVINGAAARRFLPGDRVIIAAFVLTDEPVQPKMIAVGAQNRRLPQ